MQETTEYNTEMTEQLLSVKTAVPSKKLIEEELSHRIQQVEKQIRNSCSELIATRFDSNTLAFHERNDAIQIKVRSIHEQAKAYVDRAVFQLKELLKKYVREQGDLQRRIERSSRQNSPSAMSKNSLSKSKSAKRLFETTQKSETSDNFNESKNGWPSKSRESLGKESVASASGNRVSYLREKLKEFQKINRKYEGPEKPAEKEEKQEMVKKLRNYRQYLQQSESELQPSNIMNAEDVLNYPGPKKSNYSLF